MKTVSASRTRMNELVLPNDTNALGNLMGGQLMKWMDICSAIAAQRHSNRTVVTVSADSIEFRKAIKLGEVVVIEGEVTRAFNTSMEVHLKVWNQNMISQTRVLSNEAFFTFVALDENKHPKKVPEIIAESEEEIKYYDGALRRRQMRLILGGKMKPDDATELKAFFTHD